MLIYTAFLPRYFECLLQQALESGRMSQNDTIRIVYCIGRFLPYLPNDQIITAVNEIFAPCLTQLQTLAGQDVS